MSKPPSSSVSLPLTHPSSFGILKQWLTFIIERRPSLLPRHFHPAHRRVPQDRLRLQLHHQHCADDLGLAPGRLARVVDHYQVRETGRVLKDGEWQRSRVKRGFGCDRTHLWRQGVFGA